MKKVFGISLISFILFSIFSVVLAAPPSGQTYPYKGKYGFFTSACNSGDKQGAMTDEKNTVWCVPDLSRPPAKTTGKCDAGLEPIKIPEQNIFLCIPTAETIKKGGVSSLKCPEGSSPIYDKDGIPIYCSRPITTKNPCVAINKLYDENDRLTGCRVEPLAIIGEIKLGGVGGEVQTYTTNVPIPCQPLFGGTCPSVGTPAGYIARLYQFGLMIAGLLAFGSIVYGSIKYILSAGSIGSTEEAKDIIREAIYGLVLLLGAFLILYTINPNLVNLRNPNLEEINIEAIRKDAQVENGAEQRIQTGDGGGNTDSLCASFVSAAVGFNISGQNTGKLAVTENSIEVQQKITGAIDKVIGRSGYAGVGGCISCRKNAVLTNGVCYCAPGFEQYGGDCVPPSAIPKTTEGGKQTCSDLGGICQKTSIACAGQYKPGFCPGAADIQCCVK